MAIAQDVYTNWTEVSGGSTTVAFTHAAGGSADYAAVMVSNQSGADDLTVITYGLTTMTQLAKKDRVVAGWYGYVYGLAAPATGSQTVTVTRTNTSNALGVACITFTGAKNQTAANATGTAGTSSVSSLNCTVTTTVNGCAIIGHYIMDNGGATASTNLSSLGSAGAPIGNGLIAVKSSPFPQSSSGGLTGTVTGNSGSNSYGILVAIEPAASSAVVMPRKALLGVGL